MKKETKKETKTRMAISDCWMLYGVGMYDYHSDFAKRYINH